MKVFSQPGKSEEGCSGEQTQQLRSCLCLAKTLLNSKRAADALALVDGMVPRFPSNTQLLHLRGQVLQAINNGPAAFATFMSVLSIDTCHVPSICSVGEIYKSKGMLQESLAAFSRAREVAPEDTLVRNALATVLTDLGTKAKTAGALQEGMLLYQNAIEQCPGYAPAYYNMGVLNSEAKQFDAALEWYSKATQLHPMYAEAHCNVGVILKERGQLEAAIEAYNRALAAAPNFSIVHGNLAIVLTDLGTKIKMEGKIAEGIALYEKALAHNPKYADALYNLGVAHGTVGQFDKAIFMYETAIQHNPKCAEAYNNLGVIYKDRDNLDKAMECYSAALSVKPDFPQSLNNMGVIFTAQGRAQEALTLLTAAIVSSPTYAEAHNNLGVLQRDVGAIPEALASYSRCLELVPDSRNAGQNRLLALNYIYSGKEPMVCQEHADWGAGFQRLFTPLPPPSTSDQDLDPERPLRIGYISPDLFTHSVSYFAEAPLSHHRTPAKHGAQGRVQHIAYCCTPKRDAKTARIQSAVEAAGGLWREATHLSEPDLAQLVRNDKVDILVELTGHTANNRLGVMAMRPAPIQVTWIGYPNSTGLEAVDYRFTDEKCDPLDTEQTFVEELIRLPGCFLCYTPADPEQPPVSPLPALTNGYVTFGSFNNLAKITPEVLKLWARILLAVPNSRLMMKSKPFACDTARNHFLNLLSAEGVEPWRVDLIPLVAGNTEHLAQYAHMDISLDPFPYAGTTTTCESFFMGVPCITLAGDCHAYNVGVSLLAAMGMEKEWVAHSQDEYVALAAKHASQLQRLSILRSCLRLRMLSGQLCDAPPFMERLEGVYRQLWHRYIHDGPEGMERQRKARLQQQQEQLKQQQTVLQQRQEQQQGLNGPVSTSQQGASMEDDSSGPDEPHANGTASTAAQNGIQHASPAAVTQHSGAVGASASSKEPPPVVAALVSQSPSAASAASASAPTSAATAEASPAAAAPMNGTPASAAPSCSHQLGSSGVHDKNGSSQSSRAANGCSSFGAGAEGACANGHVSESEEADAGKGVASVSAKKAREEDAMAEQYQQSLLLEPQPTAPTATDTSELRAPSGLEGPAADAPAPQKQQQQQQQPGQHGRGKKEGGKQQQQRSKVARQGEGRQ